MKPCYIFTGQSGIHTEESVGKLGRYAERPRHGKKVFIISLDRRMLPRFDRKYGSRPGFRPATLEKGALQYLFEQPKEILRELWRASVDSAFSDVKKAAPSFDAIVLVMHSVYYHTLYREFFHCVDPPHLNRKIREQGLELKSVVTFIDDIYDTYLRLRERGQLFDPEHLRERDPFTRWVKIMSQLMLALDWRSNEILAAEQLAVSLSEKGRAVDHLLLAVRHPLSVGLDLIFADRTQKVPTYISHPISEVRRLEDEGSRDLARQFKNDLNGLIDRLFASKFTIPFSPTTIDDFRVVSSKETVSKGPETDHGKGLPYEITTYSARLKPRWDEGTERNPEEFFYVRPRAEVRGSPIDPDAIFEKPEKPKKGPKKVLPSPSPTLTLFADWITAQLASRDRKLVDQSRILVVYRPYFNGNRATGVEHEIEHRNGLIKAGVVSSEEYPVFVLSPKDDLIQWRWNQLVNILRLRLVYNDTSTRLTKEDVEKIRLGLRGDPRVAGTVSEGKLTQDSVRAIIHSVMRGRDATLAVSTVGRSTLEKRQEVLVGQQLFDEWNRIVAEVNHDKLKSAIDLGKDDLYEEDDLTGGAFADLIEERLQLRSRRRRGRRGSKARSH